MLSQSSSSLQSSLLSCGICFNLLNEPQTLPCSHSFCARCILLKLQQNFLHQQQKQLEAHTAQIQCFKCPNCNIEHQYLDATSQFPKNHFLENVLLFFKQTNFDFNNLNHTTPTSTNTSTTSATSIFTSTTTNIENTKTTKNPILCDSEDGNEALKYCTECNSYLCASCCDHFHSVGKYKQHSPQSLLNYVNSPRDISSMCKRHPNHHEDLYCESCRSLICNMCRDDNHHNDNNSKHIVTSASKYAENIKSSLVQRAYMIIMHSSKFDDELRAADDRIAKLQLRLDIEKQKKSNIQRKLNDLNLIHQIVLTAIDQTFTSTRDILRNPQIVNQCIADISNFYEKLYTFDLPINLFAPPSTSPSSQLEVTSSPTTWVVPTSIHEMNKFPAHLTPQFQSSPSSSSTSCTPTFTWSLPQPPQESIHHEPQRNIFAPPVNIFAPPHSTTPTSFTSSSVSGVAEGIWSLSANSFVGNDDVYQLISNKHFEKLKDGHCSISCAESVKHTSPPTFQNSSNNSSSNMAGCYQWKIQYLPVHTSGWLLIGVHSLLKSSSSISYMDKEFVGWSVSKKHGANSELYNGEFFYSKHTQVGYLHAEFGDVLTLSLNTNSGLLRLEHSLWNVETTVRNFPEYFLHFNSFDVSFKLLSCSLIN